MSPEILLSLLKSLDPLSQGAVALLAVLAFCAARLFPARTPARIRLVVFFTLVGFAGGGLFYTGRNARVEAQKADPHDAEDKPHALATKLGRMLDGMSLVGVAHAQADEGWVFLGKYDRDRGGWVEGPTVEILGVGSGVPGAGDKLRPRRDESAYDDQPRFSIFSQTWKLGKKLPDTFPAGRRLDVVGTPVLVGQNVWCKVKRD